jgi:hypothetical protein
MIIAATGAVAAHANFATQVRPPLEAAAAEADATLVIERAPRLRFVYTKIDSSTGEAVWRWPARPSAAQESPGSAKMMGQYADILA